MVFEGFPLILGWELTLECNLRCKHCGSSAGSPRPSELSLNEAFAICDQLPELLVQEVNFTGGEPLIYKDWERIVERLVDLGISVKILTNGLALSPDNIVNMKELGVSSVGISLDGLPTTHDFIRGAKGSSESVISGIKGASDEGLPATVITTVNGLNVKELPDMLSLLASIGVKRWQIQPIFYLGRSKEVAELHLSEEAYEQLGLFVKQYLPEAEKAGVEILLGDSYGYYTEYDERDPQWRGCGAGLLSCGITSDGKVKGCLSLPEEFIEGDLRQDDLWDIWFREGAFAYTRNFHKGKLGDNCANCERGADCKGGCTAMSYGYTGRVHNDPYCFLGIRTRDRQSVSV